jgi:hypothetical protein
VVPVGGLSRQQAEQQIYQLMSEYHEDIQWDDELGTVKINGSSNIPHSKDFWFPSSAEGTPEVSIESPSGNDLNEDQILNWFLKNLMKASRIPGSRFDKESGGGNIYSDASEITRDEMKFHNFIKRIRTVFREIMVKPLRIQMMRDFPELITDHNFINNLNIEFNSNELFEEWKYLGNLEKRANIASTLSSNLMEPGGENSYYSIEWLVRNIMKMNDEQIDENAKYKMKENAILAKIQKMEEGGNDEENDMPTGPGAQYFGGDTESESGGASSSGGSSSGGGSQAQAPAAEEPAAPEATSQAQTPAQTPPAAQA